MTRKETETVAGYALGLLGFALCIRYFGFAAVLQFYAIIIVLFLLACIPFVIVTRSTR